MVHGVVFIAYCLSVVFVAVNQRWSLATTALGLASAVPPFMTVWFDRRAERTGRLAGPWRLTPGGEQPAGALERVQAWMLARPLAAAALACRRGGGPDRRGAARRPTGGLPQLTRGAEPTAISVVGSCSGSLLGGGFA